MHKIVKQSIVLFLIASLVIIPFESSALDRKELSSEEPSGIAMVFDFFALRPLGFLTFLGGTAFFIISTPVHAMGGNTETAAKKLVQDPAEFTFQRPLGHF